jgi:hypothetical protein
MLEPSTRRGPGRPPKVPESQAPTDPVTFMGVDLTGALSIRAGLRTLLGKQQALRNQADRIASQGTQSDRKAQETRDLIASAAVDAMLAGEPVPVPDAGALEELRSLHGAATAAGPARERLLAEAAALDAPIAEAHAELASAMFVASADMQAGVNRDLQAAWPVVAELMTKFLVIDRLREEFVGADATLKNVPGLLESRPWSGAVVVRQFCRSVPEPIHNPMLDFDKLSKASQPIAREIARHFGE